jgi:ketosteroid isomerase-like protein
MSQENVELIRRAFDAYNRGDMQGLLDVYHPDAAWDFSTWGKVGWAGPNLYVGHEGIADFLSDWRSPFGEDTVATVERFVAAGDKVVALCHQHERGRGSSELVLMPFAQIYSFRDGKVAWVEVYSDPLQALGAVGLSEQDAHADS